MEVIGHQYEADDFPPGPGDLSGQQLLESLSIVVVLHDVLAGVAPRHDGVDGPLVLDSQSSGHRSTRPGKGENVHRAGAAVRSSSCTYGLHTSQNLKKGENN